MYGTRGRYEVQQALNYIASEVHPSIGGLFNPEHTEGTKEFTKNNAAKKLAFLETHLIKDKRFLVGDSFTIADSYLFIVLSWTGYVGIDLAPYPNVKAYYEAIGAIDGVRSARELMATNPTSTLADSGRGDWLPCCSF